VEYLPQFPCRPRPPFAHAKLYPVQNKNMPKPLPPLSLVLPKGGKKNTALKQKPPAHLSRPSRAWWLWVTNEFELEEHHLKLLTAACESWDRCQQARRRLKKYGLTYNDRFGQPRSRPEVGIERDNRIAFARLLRELDLDIDTPGPPGRPPGRG